jgi:hypothetical protein
VQVASLLIGRTTPTQALGGEARELRGQRLGRSTPTRPHAPSHQWPVRGGEHRLPDLLFK